MWTQKKTKTNKNKKPHRYMWLLPQAGEGKLGEGGQKVQTSSYKISKSWDVIYSMLTTANNALLYALKLLRQ